MYYKTYYICHHCVNFVTHNKNDLSRHFKIKEKCNKIHKYSYEESELLSKSRKFYIKKDENILKSNLIHYIDIYEKNEIGNDDIIIKSKYEKDKILNNYLIDKNNNIYKCNECLNEFNSKKQIENHLLNKEKCNKFYLLQSEFNKIKLKKEENLKENIFNSIEEKCNKYNLSLEKVNDIIDFYFQFKK